MDPKGYYLTKPQQRQRQQQHRDGDVRRTYPMKFPVKPQVVSRPSTPVSACSTVSSPPSSTHSSSLHFFTPPTTPPKIKLQKKCPGLSERTVGATSTVAQEGHGESDECTFGSTSILKEDHSVNTVGVVSSTLEAAEENISFPPLVGCPVGPLECLSNRDNMQCPYPDWYSEACKAYKDIVLGHSFDTENVRLALEHWPKPATE
jgi:hypothetical protein